MRGRASHDASIGIARFHAAEPGQIAAAWWKVGLGVLDAWWQIICADYWRHLAYFAHTTMGAWRARL